MTTTLTLVDGRLRIDDSSKLVESPRPGQTKPCCCKCGCTKRKVFSFTMDGAEFYFLSDFVLCSRDYCGCEKYQIVARGTSPGYGGYPRIVEQGLVLDPASSSTKECCLARGSQFRSHLGMKGYTINYEIWIMCNKKADDTTDESAL